jgi:glycosyltransferase involved in cell wall biosynthesis
MGIEVLYGNWYAKHFKDWLKINGKYIDFTYLNRPHISINYIDLIKKYTKSKTFYYGHDLHYLREIREYQITGNQELLSSSQKWREIESKLINDVDVVYYPSIIEVNELKNHFPNQVIKAIPAYIYYTFDMDPLVSYNERNDLLFVGGFGHKPNIDAVLWFASEIFPRIVMEIPGVKWYIVGSNPPELIKKLNCENIIVTGFVSDPELESFYKNCKIVVVPLRYGAGVKGKVIEAMYHRNAIITTKVGSEGLPDAADFLIECDEAATFAETVVELYKDNEMLSNMAMKSQKFVEKYYSKESVMNIIHRDFTHTGITLK